MQLGEKKIESKKIYQGRIIGLREDTVELPHGVVAKREIVEHPGAVAVVALLNDEIILVKQFRTSANQILLEIPAGLMHKKEDPIDAAKRELEEETGYKAGKIKKVFEGYSSPGYSTEVIQYFLATGLTKTKQSTDEDELIHVELTKVSRCTEMIKSGEIRDNKTIIGVMIVQKELGIC